MGICFALRAVGQAIASPHLVRVVVFIEIYLLIGFIEVQS